MKSASVLLFAASAAAEYRHHSSSSSKLGYTTVYPGHGKEPVTVTAQYQPVPTYVNGKWSSYEAMSTVITDGYGKKVCVTKADQDVTVYHTKGTITHTATSEGYAKPTDYYGGKGSHSNKVWHELYEEIHEVPYKHVGPHAIPGYPGNPKYNGDKDEQYVKVKKYTGGKWTTYDHTYTYSAPEPSVTTYDAPGTYTIPAKDLTIDYPTTMPVEHTYKAEANKPCTYGGKTTDVTKPTTITAAYAAYETDGTVTKTVVHTKTITCSKPGKYTIKEPTTTVYPHDTIVTYPAVTTYAPGVYHHPAETVTITKSKQPYTCKYDQTSTYPDPSTPVYPVYPVSTPDYSTTTKDSYPEYPEETKDAYPQYPKGTPSAQKEYPQSPKGTPKADNEYPQYPKGTPSATKNAYPQYPAETPKGSKGSYPQYPKGTPSANKEYPQSPKGTPKADNEYPQYPKGTPSATKNAYPQYPAETPKGSKGSYPQYPKGTPSANKEYPQSPKGTPKADKEYPQYPKGTPKANKEYPQSPKGTPSKNSYPTPSPVYKEPAKNYGNARPGYVKRAGFAERRAAAVQV